MSPSLCMQTIEAWDDILEGRNMRRRPLKGKSSVPLLSQGWRRGAAASLLPSHSVAKLNSSGMDGLHSPGPPLKWEGWEACWCHNTSQFCAEVIQGCCNFSKGEQRLRRDQTCFISELSQGLGASFSVLLLAPVLSQGHINILRVRCGVYISLFFLKAWGQGKSQ